MEALQSHPVSGASVTKSVSGSHELRAVLGRDLRKPKRKEKEEIKKEHQAKNTWKKGKTKTQTRLPIWARDMPATPFVIPKIASPASWQRLFGQPWNWPNSDTSLTIVSLISGPGDVSWTGEPQRHPSYR
jgi:hypothetical protein